MTRWADLHMHTYYSDGTSSPEEVVREAASCGLSCVAITDHDTFEGVEPTCTCAFEHQLEVLNGIELSSEIDGRDVHILGYCFNSQDGQLLETIEHAQRHRVERMKKMIERLKTLGINNVEFEEVAALAKSNSVGRPHLALILQRKGWVKDTAEAFQKYIGEQAPAYIAKYKQTPFEAIGLIRSAGGVAVLAHPMVTNKDELIPAMAEAGLQGIEVFYPNYPSVTRDYYQKLARKYDLILTGGSDAHGKAKDSTFIGKVKIPYEMVEQLKTRAHSPQSR